MWRRERRLECLESGQHRCGGGQSWRRRSEWWPEPTHTINEHGFAQRSSCRSEMKLKVKSQRTRWGLDMQCKGGRGGKEDAWGFGLRQLLMISVEMGKAGEKQFHPGSSKNQEFPHQDLSIVISHPLSTMPQHSGPLLHLYSCQPLPRCPSSPSLSKAYHALLFLPKCRTHGTHYRSIILPAVLFVNWCT